MKIFAAVLLVCSAAVADELRMTPSVWRADSGDDTTNLLRLDASFTHGKHRLDASLFDSRMTNLDSKSTTVKNAPPTLKANAIKSGFSAVNGSTVTDFDVRETALGYSYLVFEKEKFKAYAGASLRHVSFDWARRSTSKTEYFSESSLNPVITASCGYSVATKLSLEAAGAIGKDLREGSLGASYQLTERASIGAGYRAWHFDNDGEDVTLKGPFLCVEFKF